MKLIDGTMTAAAIRQEIKDEIALLRGRRPRLDVILAGNFQPSIIYVANKTKACEEVGIESRMHHLPETVGEEELLAQITRLNQDPGVDGILVQFPLPSQIDANHVMQALDPLKDVDGFHPINRGKLFLGDPTALIPCTPLGVCELLVRYGVKTEGKRVTVVGRSNIVGKPLSLMLMQPNEKWGNATVTVAHSKTKDLKSACLEADILIAAVGKANVITADMVKEGAVVIDVGMNAQDPPEPGRKRKVMGDVDFAGVKDKCSLITPVPGGVGPMTIAMLLSNTLKAYVLNGKQASR